MNYSFKLWSQDVLIPWHKPVPKSSNDERQTTSGGDRDTTTTTYTSEDDVNHYHAYTGTSDSEQGSSSRDKNKRSKNRFKNRSFSPNYGFPSSSDLSSPNETCYSFVRRAIQKISTNKRQVNSSKLSWFLNNLESYYTKEADGWQKSGLNKNDSADSNGNGDDLPIEIRHLEDAFLQYTDLSETFSKSKSLNDISRLTLSPQKKMKMKDQVRLFTFFT